jgi:Adenylosuccinate synthetase
MFRNVLRSSATTNAFVAGAAAALSGAAFLTNRQQEPTTCGDNTVVGILQGISTKISNIEAILGGVDGKIPVKKPGIDIVLGSQWGDEGKGKLVDILSQVCSRA